MIAWLLAAALAAPADPDALLAEARRRAVVGDYAGAEIVAREAAELEGDHDIEARYLLGYALEHQGRPEQAVAIYEALLPELAGDPRLDDVRFRRAEALGRAGRYREALAQLDALEGAARSPSDRIKLDLLRGLWEIELPDRGAEERGIERITSALERAAPGDAPVHQAMARARLAELAAHQAARIPFRGTRRRKARRMEERAGLVTLASEQVPPMIALGAPDATLSTFLVAGRAFEDFGDALLDESPVRRLSRRQRALYERERAHKVEAVWVRASRYYDRGVQYAEMLGWEGPEADALRAALSRVIRRVDELSEVERAAATSAEDGPGAG